MSNPQGIFTLTATAEVRDKDGNLISSTPVVLTGEATAEQVEETQISKEKN